jgi:molybdopterin-guanine dinucleotide biosynthesis protein A
VTLAAVVLAGGAARRLGGVAKPLLTIEGTALLLRVLAAVATARPQIVVGPPALRSVLPDSVELTCEEPAGRGPVAALSAGIALVPPTTETVAVLAADLPFVTAEVVAGLHGALARRDVQVALLVDAAGRRQNLLAVWRTDALRAALSRHPGPAVRDLLRAARVAEVPPPLSARPVWLDCDTPEDITLARRLAGDPGRNGTTRPTP